MAIASASTWEIQSAGTDTAASGSFNPANASMATDLAATSATGAAPVVSSATYNFAARDVGHWVYVKSGTNWIPGWYKISSVAANAATVNATAGQCIGPLLSPLTTTGIATTASPTAGTWSVDYSQGTSIHVTDAVAATSTTITSVGTPMGKNFVGNLIGNVTGTGWNAVWAEIGSTSTTTATITNYSSGSTIATALSTGGDFYIGGALASPGKCCSLSVAGNRICIGAGTYTVTSASNNVAAGCFTLPGNTGNTIGIFEGYGTYRGDAPSSKPLIKADGAITTFTLCTSSITMVRYVAFDGNSRTSSKGLSLASNGSAFQCTAANCTNNGMTGAGSSTSLFEFCYVTGCSTQIAMISGLFNYCVSNSNTVTGMSLTGQGVGNISANNSGASSDGFITIGGQCLYNCIAYNNGRDGFRHISSAVVFTATNCVAVNNAGYGYNAASVDDNYWLRNCAGYNNTSGNINTTNVPARQTGFVTLSGDPFVSAGTGNFALNNTSGAGAACRASGIPGPFIGISTTGYIDIGAAEHQDSGGGSGLIVAPNMVGVPE